MKKITLNARRSGALAGTTALVLGGGAAALALSPTSTTAEPDCSTQAKAAACLAAVQTYVAKPVPTVTQTVTRTVTASPASPAPTTSAPTTSATPTTSPTSTAAPTRYASGLPWSSGAFAMHRADKLSAFESGRGRTLDNVTVFPSRESWPNLHGLWYLDSQRVPTNFKGDIAVGMPLWPQNSSVSVNSDAEWKRFARDLSKRDPDAYVRLGWEMNIPGPYWKITPQNESQWIARFNSAAVAMKSEAPNLRIIFNPNCGPDQTGVDSRKVFEKVKHNVDGYGIDMYDAWPADTSDANWERRLNGPRGLQDSLNFAKANGMKFSLPEWGLGCNTSGCQWAGNAGGDNPRFINNTLGFLNKNRQHVDFESYFSEGDSYIKSDLFFSSNNPKASAAYKAKLNEIASSR